MDREGRLDKERNPWQQVKHAWPHFNLLQTLKEKPLSSGFSTELTFISATAVPPLQDSLAKRREDGGTKIIVNKFYFKPKAKGKYLMYKKGGREGLDFRFREGTLKKKQL